jgi:hypothetical protein
MQARPLASPLASPLARPLTGLGSGTPIFWAIEEAGIIYLIVLGDADTPIIF